MIVWFYGKICVVFAKLANHLKNNRGLNIKIKYIIERVIQTSMNVVKNFFTL